jgi:hypothetical protein
VSESSPTSLETMDFQQILNGRPSALVQRLPISLQESKSFRMGARLDVCPTIAGDSRPINNILTIYREYGRERNDNGNAANLI